MAAPDHGALEEEIRRQLAGTPYESKSLAPLSGGTANFVYRVVLAKPLEDGAAEVVIKHSEDYVAQSPDMKLEKLRCKIEEGCFQKVSALPRFTSPLFTVGTPKLYHFNEESSNQILEYLPSALSLKEYALKNWTGPLTQQLEAQSRELGRSLGVWLKSFHDWSGRPEQVGLRELVAENIFMQNLKYQINYPALIRRIQRYPDILGGAKDVFEKVAAATKAELEDRSQLHVIHGDFWTGNIILPDHPLGGASPTPMLVLDWEMAQLGVLPLDLGQMLAEMYLLKVFRGIDAGLRMIEGFLAGYGAAATAADDDNFVFRTLLHVGAHVVFVGGWVASWGDATQMEAAVARGRDIVVKAWEKDKEWFLGGDLACFFANAPRIN